jgi:hypothetical protein
MSTEYWYLLNANAEHLSIDSYSSKNPEFITGNVFSILSVVYIQTLKPLQIKFILRLVI